MAGNMINNPRPQFLDGNGDPFALGTLSFFEDAARATPLDTFSDADLAAGNVNPNPIILDSAGRPANGGTEIPIFLQQQAYYVVLKNAAGTEIWDAGNVSNILQVDITGVPEADTYAALTALTKASLTDLTVYQVNGRTAKGDIEPVSFLWNAASSATANAGTIIASDEGGATGRWLMLFNGSLNPKWFNAKGDGSTDDSTAVQAAIDYAETLVGAEILFEADNIFLFGSGLTVTSANIRLKGGGPSSILKMSAAVPHMFTLTSAHGFGLDSLRFEGAATSDATDQYVVFTQTANPSREGTVTNCEIGGPNGTTAMNNGFIIDTGSNDWYFANNDFQLLIGNTSGHGYAIITDSLRCRIIGNNHSAATGNGRHGTYLTIGAKYCSVVGNHYVGFESSAITLQATAAQAGVNFNIIVGNTVDTSNNLFANDGAIALLGNCNFNTFDSNIITNSGGHGYYIGGSFSGTGQATDNSITGGSISLSQRNGIRIAGPLRTKIIGVHVADSDQAAAGNADILLVKDQSVVQTAADTHITGCSTKSGSSADAAFEIDPTVTVPTGTVLNGNDFPIATNFSVETNGVTDVLIDGKLLFKTTHDFPSAAANTTISQTFTVPGANINDVATVQVKSLTNGLVPYAQVSAANTVKVYMSNVTTGALDNANSDLTIWVQRSLEDSDI